MPFGLPVFILTLFRMKQQNYYSLLLNEYHKLDVLTPDRQAETE